MKRTFTTIMPDQIGAFLRADLCLSQLGLNITRVSYNKAVDAHMLFIEVEGTPEQLREADEELTALGYLQDPSSLGEVMLLEFQLKDVPGAVLPILQLIHQYAFNISYISSQENGTGYQNFKMGLFVENERKISAFMQKAAMICPIRVLNYSKSAQILDNTVFYLSFANDISEKLGLREEEKRQLIVNSNLVMQLLDEHNGAAHKTFEYIGRFADQLKNHQGVGYRPRITRHATASGLPVLLLEPPCGSNTAVITCPDDTLLFADCGFACYQEEQWAVLAREIPDFRERRKALILTHGDVDHTGCVDLFDEVYLGRACYENFRMEREGGEAIREENPTHAPYVRISKILSGYHTPEREDYQVVGTETNGDAPLSYAGSFSCHGLTFDLYEGRGGHVRGEMVFLERQERMVFTGDIFVNIHGFTKEQAAFNQLAPYLMTSVDTDPALAKAEREAFRSVLTPGEWSVYSGHGAMLPVTV